MKRVSARVCILPGKVFVKRADGVYEPSTLKKKHCGKMVNMIDLKVGARRQAHAVVRVRGKDVAAVLTRVKNT